MNWLEDVTQHVNVCNEESPGSRVLRVTTDANVPGINAPDHDHTQVLLAELYYTPDWLVGRAYKPMRNGSWTPIQPGTHQIAINQAHVVSVEVLTFPKNAS